MSESKIRGGYWRKSCKCEKTEGARLEPNVDTPDCPLGPKFVVELRLNCLTCGLSWEWVD